jgi:DNA-binding FadR family transcriptional regulator
LGTDIVSGVYPPGTVLSSEVEFAEALDVSRGALREAMQVLAAKGLVESRPKAGTKVLPRTRWNLLDPDVLAWAFSGEPDPVLVRGIFELRAVVEPAAARFAAQRRDREDLRAMKDALATMRRHTLATDAGKAADRDFHDAILRATRNPRWWFFRPVLVRRCIGRHSTSSALAPCRAIRFPITPRFMKRLPQAMVMPPPPPWACWWIWR